MHRGSWGRILWWKDILYLSYAHWFNHWFDRELYWPIHISCHAVPKYRKTKYWVDNLRGLNAVWETHHLLWPLGGNKWCLATTASDRCKTGKLHNLTNITYSIPNNTYDMQFKTRDNLSITGTLMFSSTCYMLSSFCVSAVCALLKQPSCTVLLWPLTLR